MRNMLIALATVAGTLAHHDAHAFCGTYVGPPDATPTNATSRIALARDGGRVTLTMANDYQGPLGDFGIVVPVPPEVTADDLAVVDAALFERLDEYSAPRMVAYGCEQWSDTGWTTSGASSWGAGSSSGGCGGSGTAATVEPRRVRTVDTGATVGDAGLYDVRVEALIAIGEYQMALLQADDGGSLADWLALQGFALAPEVEAALDEAITSGQKFLAARVNMAAVERLEDEPAWLRPIQFSYPSDSLVLPVGLGALSSSGVQDLVIYVASDASDGAWGISNYRERPLEDECMLESDFSAWYEDQLDGLMDGPVAEWTTEYTWQPTKCDPCTWGGPLDSDSLATMGFDRGPSAAFFTRLHLRYRPDQVPEDLVLAPTWSGANDQIRLIAHDPGLAGEFPACAGETFDRSGTCGGAGFEPDPPSAAPAPNPAPASGCLCASLPMGPGAVGLALAFAAVRRRRTEVRIAALRRPR